MSTIEKTDRPRGIRWRRHLLGLLLAGGCLALLFTRVSGRDLAETWRSIAPAYAVVGFGVVLVSYLLKALRFKILLGKGAPFGKLFGVTIAQNVIAQIVPARAGDLSYVVLVRRTGMASVGYALASLLICRFVDLVLVFCMYLGSLLILRPAMPVFTQVAWGLAILIGLAVLLAGVLIVGRLRVVGLFETVLKATRLMTLKPVRYLWTELLDALPSVARLRPVQHFLPIAGLSLVIWSATLGWIWLLLAAVGVRLTLPELLLICSFTQAISLLPILLFGGVGTGDALNTIVLVAFGHTVSQAAAFSLVARVLSLIYQAAMGLMALVILPRLSATGDNAAGPAATEEATDGKA